MGGSTMADVARAWTACDALLAREQTRRSSASLSALLDGNAHGSEGGANAGGDGDGDDDDEPHPTAVTAPLLDLESLLSQLTSLVSMHPHACLEPALVYCAAPSSASFVVPASSTSASSASSSSSSTSSSSSSSSLPVAAVANTDGSSAADFTSFVVARLLCRSPVLALAEADKERAAAAAWQMQHRAAQVCARACVC